MNGIHQIIARRGSSQGPRVGRPDAIIIDQRQEKGRPRHLYCARCRHPITDAGQRISVAGGHRHTCTNPLGITYELGCFAQAPGALHHGPPVSEHSWFTGYAWRVAICGNCNVHLGWGFHGDGAPPFFFGLILDHLTESPDEERFS